MYKRESKLNIAIVTPFPLITPGGAEKVTFLLSKFFQESGHNLKIFDITILNKKYRGIFDLKLMGQYKLAYDLGKLFNRESENFDLVICNGMYGWNIHFPRTINIIHGNVAANAVSRRNSMKSLSYYKTRFIDSWFHTLSFRNKRIVAVSKRTGYECKKYNKISHYDVIRNAVDTKVFKQRKDKRKWRKRFRLPEDGFLGLFVGRPEYAKGIDIIEKVAALLNESHKIVAAIPDNHFHAKNVISIINVPYVEMPYLYNACDYFILPSRYEGCSLALLEAMSSRLPVIVSNVGIASDIAEKDGFLGETILGTLNVTRYVAKIKQLESDKSLLLELGQRGREYTAKNHSLENFKQEYLRLINQVVTQTN